MTESNTAGMELIKTVRDPFDMGNFVRQVIHAGIARCISPERETICDEPAVNVFWVDAMEWYPCCAKHTIVGDQWIGTTRFQPHNLSIAVIPNLAEKWLGTLPEYERKLITIGTYERGT